MKYVIDASATFAQFDKLELIGQKLLTHIKLERDNSTFLHKNVHVTDIEQNHGFTIHLDSSLLDDSKHTVSSLFESISPDSE